MTLSPARLTTLRAAINAETDPAFVAVRDAGSHSGMADWLNAPAVPAAEAWLSNADRRTIDGAPSYANFDTIVAGKRDAWRLFLEGAPRDFTIAKSRKLVIDVWGASNADTTEAFKILSAVTRAVTRAEALLGGAATATEGTGTGAITAKRLNWEGPLSPADISAALAQ